MRLCHLRHHHLSSSSSNIVIICDQSSSMSLSSWSSSLKILASGGKIPKVAVRNMHILILSGDKIRLSTAMVIMGRLHTVYTFSAQGAFLSLCVSVFDEQDGGISSQPLPLLYSLLSWWLGMMMMLMVLMVMMSVEDDDDDYDVNRYN